MINGTEDPWVKPEETQRLTHLLLESDLILLPFCGHMPQEEKPNEVARKLEEFVKNLNGGVKDFADFHCVLGQV